MPLGLEVSSLMKSLCMVMVMARMRQSLDGQG
jgi:hypothetical protein